MLDASADEEQRTWALEEIAAHSQQVVQAMSTALGVGNPAIIRETGVFHRIMGVNADSL